MDLDSNWIWMFGIFWLGVLVGVGGSAMVQIGREADARRSRARPTRSVLSDLQADTVTRF